MWRSHLEQCWDTILQEFNCFRLSVQIYFMFLLSYPAHSHMVITELLSKVRTVLSSIRYVWTEATSPELLWGVFQQKCFWFWTKTRRTFISFWNLCLLFPFLHLQSHQLKTCVFQKTWWNPLASHFEISSWKTTFVCIAAGLWQLRELHEIHHQS